MYTRKPETYPGSDTNCYDTIRFVSANQPWSWGMGDVFTITARKSPYGQVAEFGDVTVNMTISPKLAYGQVAAKMA